MKRRREDDIFAADSAEELGSLLASMPVPAELDRALIKYATVSCRLLFIEQRGTWREFHTGNAENADKFSDLSAAELCKHFEQAVLPKVLTYELTEKELKILRLLDIHPEYERVPDGYRRVLPEQRPAYSRLPKAAIDYRLLNAADQLEPLELDDSPSAAASCVLETKRTQPRPLHTLVTTGHYPLNIGGACNAEISKENAALLSAVLVNHYELSNVALLEPEEMLQRLRAAKYAFTKSNRLPVADVAVLLKLLHKMRQLRKAIIDSTCHCFL